MAMPKLTAIYAYQVTFSRITLRYRLINTSGYDPKRKKLENIWNQTTRRNNPEDSHLHTRHRENLTSHYLRHYVEEPTKTKKISFRINIVVIGFSLCRLEMIRAISPASAAEVMMVGQESY
jgi:hypothetical protein